MIARFLFAAFALACMSATPSLGQMELTVEAVANLDMAAVLPLQTDDVRRVQQRLKDRGADPGPIDGVVGLKTTEAIRKFQSRYGMKPRGQIDNQLLFAIGEADLAMRQSQ